MIDLVTIINILVILLTVLNAIVSGGFIPPEALPYVLLVVALLNVILDFLRGRLPANLAWVARPKR